ncbi:YciI-like protein [Trinickia sp. LjRoot230]|uniref:YciI-like protein n=1 Tax=Trinickia sp. LjRoot230 TaxID=3342288 RepID=UPI003ECF4C61
MHFLLFYDVAPDYLQRRAEFRAAHLSYAWQAVERGELVLGGALGDPVDRSVLLFQCESKEIVDAFAKKDPYVLNGVVTGWQIRPWTTVVGESADNPLH